MGTRESTGSIGPSISIEDPSCAGMDIVSLDLTKPPPTPNSPLRIRSSIERRPFGNGNPELTPNVASMFSDPVDPTNSTPSAKDPSIS